MPRAGRAPTTPDARAGELPRSLHYPSPALSSVLSLPKSPSRHEHGTSPSPSRSPPARGGRQEHNGGSGSRRRLNPADDQVERGSNPTLTSVRPPPSLHRVQQQRQQREQQQQQQQPGSDGPGPAEGTQGTAQQQRSGSSNGTGGPTTPTVLEWGLNSLASCVTGGERGEEGEIQPGRLNAQDAWSAFSPGLTPREEASTPPPAPPPPTPAPASASASIVENGEGGHGMTEKRVEAKTAMTASDNNSAGGREERGGGVVVGPAKTATGGDRVSPSAAAAAAVEGRTEEDRSTSVDPANHDYGGSGTGGGGGCVEGGGSRDQVVCTAVGGRQETVTRPQHQRQCSSSTSVRTPVEPPTSPALIVTDSPRSPGGPLWSLRPQALLKRIQRSGSQSPSKSPLPKKEIDDQTIADSPRPPRGGLCTLKPQAPLEMIERSPLQPRWNSPLSKKQNNGHQTSAPTRVIPGGREEDTRQTEVAGVVSTTDRSTGASPPPPDMHCSSSAGTQRATSAVPNDRITPIAPTPGEAPGEAPVAAPAETAEVGEHDTKSSTTDDTSTQHLQSNGCLRHQSGWSHDVASIATDWLASFEERFMPCLVTEARAEVGVNMSRVGKAVPTSTASAGVGSNLRARSPDTEDGSLLPPAITRVLHEVGGHRSDTQTYLYTAASAAAVARRLHL